MLPGCDGSKYLRMQPGLMLLVATAVGMLYAFLFPFIGMAVVLTAVTRKVLESVVGLVGTSLSFHWNPKNVYLTGKKKKKRKRKSDSISSHDNTQQERLKRGSL